MAWVSRCWRCSSPCWLAAGSLAPTTTSISTSPSAGASARRGLPIGNLISQCWSNCYLDPLDQFVTRALRCGAYLRCVDDFALFDDDPFALRHADEQVRAFLAQRLRLRVHESSAQVHRSCHGLPWLGFVVSSRAMRLKSRKVVEACRRLGWLYRSWQESCITFGELQASAQGWLAHARLGSGNGVIRVVLDRMR